MIKLYSTNCPKCRVLKVKLKNKGIEFEEIHDTELMLSKGFTSVPMLEVNDAMFDFNEAIKWIDERNN